MVRISLFSVPHLECTVWFCHMLSRAEQLWLLNILYPTEGDPISHFKRLGDREQSLLRVRRKSGVVRALGKPLHFTLVFQCLQGLPQEVSSVPYVWPQWEGAVRWDVYMMPSKAKHAHKPRVLRDSPVSHTVWNIKQETSIRLLWIHWN